MKGSSSTLQTLHEACSILGRQSDIIRILDSEPGLLSAENFEDEGNTCLHYACAVGALDVVKILLKRGAPLNKQNDLGWTPLMQACYAGHSDIVSTLIQAQADVTIVNKLKCTALTLGCYNGNEKIVRCLIEAGAEFLPAGADNKTESYFNPMLAACVRGNAEALRELMTAFHSTALSMKDSYNGETPLSISAVFNWTQLVEILLKEGADADSVDVNNRTALDLATMCKSRQCKALLKAKTDKTSTTPSLEIHPLEHPIIDMAKQGDLKGLREALDREPSLVGARNSEDGATVLMYACVAGHIAIVKHLVNRGANLDEQDFLSGWTALMQATYHNKTETVKYLLEAGADASIKAHQGFTAFDIASLIDNVDGEITQLLAAKMKNTAVNFSQFNQVTSNEEHGSSNYHNTKRKTNLSYQQNIKTSSTPVLNKLPLKDQIVNGLPNSPSHQILQLPMGTPTNNTIDAGGGVVKNLWSKVTGKIRDFKLTKNDMNRVNIMQTSQVDTTNMIGSDPDFVCQPRYGGWVPISGHLSGSEGHLFRSEEITDSGIFSTPSMYSIQIEPNHMQATKLLEQPVVPPFCAVPSSIDVKNNLQLSRHKSSFTKKHTNITSHRQLKPVKRTPPNFLQPRKPQHSMTASNNGSSTTTVPKFDQSEHSNHVSPQSSGDFRRQNSTNFGSSGLHRSPSHFATSQHITSPQYTAYVPNTNLNLNKALALPISQLSSGITDNQQLKQHNPGILGTPPRLGHSHKPSFGSSFSSTEFNVSSSSNPLATQLHPPTSNQLSTSSSFSQRKPSSFSTQTDQISPTGGSSNHVVDVNTSGISSSEQHQRHKNSILSCSSIGRDDSNNMTNILSQLSLLKYKHIFDQQEVDAEVLLGLTESDLDELGIQQKTSKEQILTAISLYNKKKNSNNQSSINNNSNNNKSQRTKSSSNGMMNNSSKNVNSQSVAH